ncbi:MAG TPA: hotdog domain-containing protein [Amycolatopsis sp.]|nr:hotdog domain-containing protein [Amycolatopsis sp.]
MLFACTIRITMADVDAAGIIFYGSPLRWAENLFSSWLGDIGHPLRTMFAERIATPAVAVHVTYRSHVTLDDECRLTLSTARIGTTSFTLRCEVRVADAAAVAVETLATHVYTEYTHPSSPNPAKTRARPLPGWLRTALEKGLR